MESAGTVISASIFIPKAAILVTLPVQPKNKPTSKSTTKSARFAWSPSSLRVNSSAFSIHATTLFVSNALEDGAPPTTNALLKSTSAPVQSVVKLHSWSFPATIW
jgi:hypothetical protein